ncbi:Regulator of nucleoside diphosphate kinase [Croceitalea dokdonensis DOKDO 023]|uniref:Regulator of nucleoside diphosphate kinase n=1 Tax=Croceitalea dokdonensis DOKDO 023 TaxID=1300341 RepID=A0A0P7AFB2_9FLAO|nr:GreA/GreB family elongation factor [Croceitalea dokdonensis]KPM31995.1 Regulator of nucleoside diphosphate kinase [Croceitalea dokdonensis DOKDO 023]
MKYGSLVIEKKEYVLLKRLMNLSGFYKDDVLRKSISKLSAELETAHILDESEMPIDVVRLHSETTVTSKTGWQKTFQLVMPKDSDFKADKISIITPMGSAVIGYAKGDTIVWDFPSGKQQLMIENVVQGKKHINLDMVL